MSSDVSKLLIGEKLVEDETTIQNHIINHFQCLFMETIASRPKVRGLDLRKASEDHNIMFTKPFELEEIKAAVDECD